MSHYANACTHRMLAQASNFIGSLNREGEAEEAKFARTVDEADYRNLGTARRK
jgi:hypothetical protein